MQNDSINWRGTIQPNDHLALKRSFKKKIVSTHERKH